MADVIWKRLCAAIEGTKYSDNAGHDLSRDGDCCHGLWFAKQLFKYVAIIQYLGR